MNKERERQILKELLIHHKVSVPSLAKMLYASEPSIRRDLISLENQGLIRRVHGGAIIEENSISTQKIPFALRELEQTDEKILMAKQAVQLIKDYDVIFLDASSSAYHLVPFLPLKHHLTVMTSGVKTLLKLGDYGIKALSTGGVLLPSCQSLVGEEALNSIEHINANIAFFSCRGLSEEGYLTDISDQENYVRQKMIRHASQSYLLCAGNKIGKKYFHNLCTVKDITGVISLSPLPSSFSEYGCFTQTEADSQINNKA